MQRESNLGLNGLDPVEFLTHLKPIAGRANFTAKYEGKTYVFLSRQNQELFSLNPVKFVPHLDGCCPLHYALTGKRVPGNPNYANPIHDRLFLFSSPWAAMLCQTLKPLVQLAVARYGRIEAKFAPA